MLLSAAFDMLVCRCLPLLAEESADFSKIPSRDERFKMYAARMDRARWDTEGAGDGFSQGRLNARNMSGISSQTRIFGTRELME